MMKCVKSEDGYSLVESLVAMSLLLAILVPTAMLLVYIGGNTLSKDKITSFTYVQNEMEWVLASKTDTTFVKKMDETWWVKTQVNRDQNLYTIKVGAYKRDTLSQPYIQLETARLWYKE
ncbi:MAG: hypothetical protein WC967_09450 [Balneolaceae bacterium]